MVIFFVFTSEHSRMSNVKIKYVVVWLNVCSMNI